MLDKCIWTLRLGSSDASRAPGNALFRAQRALTPYSGVCATWGGDYDASIWGTEMRSGPYTYVSNCSSRVWVDSVAE
jgi:hypothetical protein